jgi:hypothetical protein
VPRPPLPAFQQILYGFPRGEFVASTVDVDQEYARDRLIYGGVYRRTFSPYGFSNVEQALRVANSYLKRMGWLVSEFDDGTLPDTFIETDMEVANPNDLRCGRRSSTTRSRRRHRPACAEVPAPRVHARADANASEKYNPDLDELFIKICCMCFDVMPTEIGFPPKSGIGGKGHQEGEESSSYRKGIRPSVVWLQSTLHQDLAAPTSACPPSCSSRFLGYQQEDQKELEEMADLRPRSGRSTINEERAARGQPLWDFEEADSPYVVTGSGIVFLEGARKRQAREPTSTRPSTPPPRWTPRRATAAGVGDDPVTELGKFAGYARKRAGSGKWRPFTFKAVQPELAGLLNGWGELAALGDVDGARRDQGPHRPGGSSVKKTRAVRSNHQVEKQADGTILVYGKATGPDLDADQQIMPIRRGWPRPMPKWFESGANVREMHQPIAAGVGQTLEQQGDDWYLKTLVVDPARSRRSRPRSSPAIPSESPAARS